MKTMNPILCSPTECLQLRRPHSDEEMNWATETMHFYCCRPINKESEQNLREFIMDVFAAGRISGVREERAKKTHGEIA